MNDSLLSDKKIIIASYAHIIRGKYTTIGGPALALKDFLRVRAKELLCVWQPMPISDTLSIRVEFYEKNNPPRLYKLPVINLSFGRKKTISFIYIILKLRDIFSVFFSLILFPKKADIFIGVEALDALAGVCLRKLGLFKLVIYYNLDYGVKRFSIPMLNWLFHFLDKLAVNNSDVTWSLSEQMLIERDKRGIVNNNGRHQLVVPIGINFDQIQRLPFENIERRRIVYLGLLEELQGVQLLIEVFPQLLIKFPDVSLVVIGSGNFEPDLKRIVRGAKLENHIRFTGTVSDEEAREILCKSAIGVAPYMDNAYSNTRFTEPTKPKTYLSCGLPVVITRIVKIAFDIDNATAGIAIDYNKADLIEALSKLLSDDALYKEYRQNAIAFAAQYDWKNIFGKALAQSLSA